MISISPIRVLVVEDDPPLAEVLIEELKVRGCETTGAFTVKEARGVLERLMGAMNDWGTMDRWLAEYLADPEMRRSVRASSFTASLELAREGVLEIRQEAAFKPIYMRRGRRAA